jgi:hypothetical protein
MILEYHHNMAGQDLAWFLDILQKAGFKTQFDASNMPLAKRGYQNLMIHCYRD